VVREHPDAHLAIAGIGQLQGELEQLAAELGLADSVTFLGWVEDVYDLMAAADVFVQSSTDEALPQTIIEAAGLGVPVVATAAGGVPEILGPAAEMIEAGDVGRFAEVLSVRLSDLAAARSRAVTDAEKLRAHFDASRMAREYADAYEEIGLPR
jgi:glycosyltransferase involved in cell wall biosynthesis